MKILKFGSAGCRGCAIMRPIWEEIEKEKPELETVYYEARENMDIARQYNIIQLPSFVFLKDDEVVKVIEGETSKEEIEKIINLST